MHVQLIPALSDSYFYLLTEGGATAVVDPGEAQPVIDVLEAEGRGLDLILNTHHHGDHIDGNAALKARYGAKLIGPAAETRRIPGMDQTVSEGDEIEFAGNNAQVIETPGHTSGHVSFHFAGAGVLFCGDTLFSLGCGRVFEGTPEQMWDSLKKLRALPGETLCYCGHEYTQSNARFALTIEPGNAALKARADEIDRLRGAGRPTIPFGLEAEKATNPFLRADAPELLGAIGRGGGDPVGVFADIRARKDRF